MSSWFVTAHLWREQAETPPAGGVHQDVETPDGGRSDRPSPTGLAETALRQACLIARRPTVGEGVTRADPVGDRVAGIQEQADGRLLVLR